MALSKTIELDNGVSLNYHVVDTVEILNNSTAKVLIHGFTSKEFYTKAMQKSKLQADQNKLVEDFRLLMEKEEPTKTEQKKLDKLQKQINDLADKINSTVEYDDCVLGEIIIEINDISDFSKTSVEKAILKTDQFKLAKIVS